MVRRSVRVIYDSRAGLRATKMLAFRRATGRAGAGVHGSGESYDCLYSYE